MHKKSKPSILIPLALCLLGTIVFGLYKARKHYSKNLTSHAPIEVVGSAAVIDLEGLKLTPFQIVENPAKKPLVVSKKIVQPYKNALTLKIDVRALKANASARRSFNLPLHKGETAKVTFNKMVTHPNGAIIFEGAVASDRYPDKRRPASLIISGNFVEGSFPTPDGVYRLISGPGDETLLVEMNSKQKVKQDRF